MEGTQPDFPPAVVQKALREVRGTGAARSTQPQPPCRVLLASRAPGGLASLGGHVGGGIEVATMEHIGRLMEVAPRTQDERVALVLDCRAPTMHPASVAGLADELPYGWWVVAWGIDSLTWDELEPDRQGNLHWVRCPEEAEWVEVAGLVTTLLSAAR